MIPPSRQRGMTLLEVIIAVAMVVLFSAVMMGFYDQVGRIRRHVGGRATRVMNTRRVMDRLTTELQQAIIYPVAGGRRSQESAEADDPSARPDLPSDEPGAQAADAGGFNEGLNGQAHSFRFMTTTIPARSAWAVVSGTENAPPPTHDVEWVGYRLRTSENEDGELVIDGLERTSQRIISAVESEEGVQIESQLMAPSVKFLALYYFDGSGWGDQWTTPDLPLAVEIILGATPLPEGMEVQEYIEQYPVNRRTIYVPASRQARQEGGDISAGGRP